MSHYLLPCTPCRAAVVEVTADFIWTKRVRQAYGYGFLALSVRPLNFVVRVVKNREVKAPVKQSVFALIQSLAKHGVHALLAAAAAGTSSAFLRSVAVHDDNADRRMHLYIGRLTDALRLPRFVPALIGEAPSAFDIAQFESSTVGLHALAAAQDSFKRNILSDVAGVVVQVSSSWLCKLAGADANEYATAATDELGSLVLALTVNMVCGEVASAVARLVAPKRGDVEFWGEFVGRAVVGPMVTSHIELTRARAKRQAAIAAMK